MFTVPLPSHDWAPQFRQPWAHRSRFRCSETRPKACYHTPTAVAVTDPTITGNSQANCSSVDPILLV